MYQAAFLLSALTTLPVQGFHGCYGGSPVRHVTVSFVGGKVQVREYTVQQAYEIDEITVNVKKEDGKTEQVKQTITRVKSVPVAMQREYDAAKVQFLDNERRKVPGAVALSRLETARPALAVNDEREINPAYFSILKQGTFVLILPSDPPVIIEKAPTPPAEKLKTSDHSQSFTSVIAGEPKQDAGPTGPAPLLARARLDGKRIHIEEASEFTDLIKVKVAKEIDGVMKELIAEMTVVRSTATTRTLDSEWIKGCSVFGKEYDARTLADKLQKPTTVLVSADGKAVDPYYLRVIQEGTIVVVAPTPYYAVPTVVPAPAPQKFPTPGKVVPAPKPG